MARLLSGRRYLERQYEKETPERKKTGPGQSEIGPTPVYDDSLGGYVEATTQFKLEEWQWIVCQRLEKLVHQKGQRILFHGPPQFGKSIITSQRLPSYLVGKDPTHRIRLACYNQRHAERFSKVNIQLLNSAVYRRMFPDPGTRIPKNASATEWSTVARRETMDGQPSFAALGLGSGFTGLGVDTFILDDPYKGSEEANSKTIRDSIWDWWLTVVLSRMNPDTNVVVMFHRWNDDDIAGNLERQGGWEKYRFAAIGDGEADDPMHRAPDVPLSPRYSLEYLREVERQQGATNFLALYQGRPMPVGGGLLKRAKFQLCLIDALEGSWTDTAAPSGWASLAQ